MVFDLGCSSVHSYLLMLLSCSTMNGLHALSCCSHVLILGSQPDQKVQNAQAILCAGAMQMPTSSVQ